MSDASSNPHRHGFICASCLEVTELEFSEAELTELGSPDAYRGACPSCDGSLSMWTPEAEAAAAVDHELGLPAMDSLARPYVAAPDEGHDVEGLWVNFDAASRSGYATAATGLSKVLQHLGLPVALVPHPLRPIDPDEMPSDRPVLREMFREKVGLPQCVVVAGPVPESTHMAGPTSICWTTHEGTRVGPIAVQRIQRGHFKAIWVKSAFAGRAFLESGVGLRDIHLVRPPIFDAVESVPPLRARRPDPAATFRIGHCGTWLPRKGHRELLTAYHMAFDRSQDVVLEIRTSAPRVHVSDLKDKVAEIIGEIRGELEEPPAGWPAVRIHFGDDLDDAAFAAWLDSLDLYANPSFGEGTGIPQTWALGAGIPMVTTGFGGVGETLRHIDAAHDHPLVPGGVVPFRLEEVPLEMGRVNAVWEGSRAEWGAYDVAEFASRMNYAYRASLARSAESAERCREAGERVREMYSFDVVLGQVREALAADFPGLLETP